MTSCVVFSLLPVLRAGLLLLLFTIAGALPLLALQTATLSGTLTDSTGSPVEGASVMLRNSGSNESRQSSTDAIGHYTFTLLQAGSFEVSGEKEGFTQSTRQGPNTDSPTVSPPQPVSEIWNRSLTASLSFCLHPI